MTLREWDAKHGPEASAWQARLRRSQRQHERGTLAYADHMTIVDAYNTWLGDRHFLDAWDASKP